MRLLVFMLEVYMMYLFVAMCWSEYRNITMFEAMGELAHRAFGKLKEGYNRFFIEAEEICYPTYIGYDSNGVFCIDKVMDEFKDLEKIFDGVFFLHSALFTNNEVYYFKFARIIEEGSLLELTQYTDKIVEGIVTKYLGRMGYCAIPNVSAVEIVSGELCISIARNPKGQLYNEQYKQNLYRNLKQIENEAKVESQPIQVKEDDLLF